MLCCQQGSRQRRCCSSPHPPDAAGPGRFGDKGMPTTWPTVLWAYLFVQLHILEAETAIRGRAVLELVRADLAFQKLQTWGRGRETRRRAIWSVNASAAAPPTEPRGEWQPARLCGRGGWVRGGCGAARGGSSQAQATHLPKELLQEIDGHFFLEALAPADNAAVDIHGGSGLASQPHPDPLQPATHLLRQATRRRATVQRSCGRLPAGWRRAGSGCAGRVTALVSLRWAATALAEGTQVQADALSPCGLLTSTDQ